MHVRRFFTVIALSATILGMAACSSGPGAGFVPAAPQTAAASRSAKDDFIPHP